MKYSKIKDVKDELIKQYSKQSDHDEAQEYVEKVLSKMGVDVDNVQPTPLLKQLSVTYATYKRAFYESGTKDDVFYQKYIEYEQELRDLTAELIRNCMDKDSKIFSEVFKEPTHD